MSLEDQNTGGAPVDQQANTGAPAAPDARQGQDNGQGGGDQGKRPDQRSLLDDGGKPDERADVQAAWRDDWREKLAGGDDKFLAQLRRYATPENYAKAGYEAQQRIRQGAVKEPLPEKPTDEQLAAFRKDNGIPEVPEAYEIKPSNGYVFSEADQPMLEGFKKFAHERNWTPAQVNQGADFVAQLSEQNAAQQQEADAGYRRESEDRLREEWGGDFRRNIGTIKNFLASHAPEGVAERLMGARMADGRLLGDDPGALAFLVRAARDANPAGTVVPAGTADAAKSITEELSALTEMQRNDPDKFDKADGGRYRKRKMELLEVEGKMKQRA